MKKRSFKQDFLVLLSCFIISRVITRLLGMTFGYNALFEYWQYLDVTSLKTNLLSSLWFQHSQPPVFNFIIGIILKISGEHNKIVIESCLLALSFCNCLLLLKITQKLQVNNKIAMGVALFYLMSPATMLLENELFYTSFISFLLLVAGYFIIKFNTGPSWQNLSGTFASLSLICLTRSMYHFSWFILVIVIFLFYWRKKPVKNMVMVTGFFFTVLVMGWYLKNYIVFNNFSASSWLGMNFSRIVFHDTKITDATNIASIPAFMPASYYQKFISKDYRIAYEGLNDHVLLDEKKNDIYINMNNVAYLQVSKKFMQAGLQQVRTYPLSYVREVAVSAVIFFTPASSYFKLQDNNYHIRYYDLLYSFNLSHLFTGSLSQKKALVGSAIPKFILYVLVIGFFVRKAIKSRSFSLLNCIIIVTILFSFVVGSLLDYGENMRFRFEVEPLFLVLAAQLMHTFTRQHQADKIS